MKNSLILFLYIIHICALIGIGLGYADFFLPKSPLNLLYILLLTVLFYPLSSLKSLSYFFTVFVVGMAVEYVGVHTSWLFGEYYYGNNLGPKMDGVPYLIGVNWAVLTFVTAAISSNAIGNIYLKSALGAALMVLIDFFLEQVCDFSGYWFFKGGAGIFNYLCWFVVAFMLHIGLHKLSIRGNLKISIHIYLVQLLYAAILWLITTTIL
jgi:putative membrane protein